MSKSFAPRPESSEPQELNATPIENIAFTTVEFGNYSESNLPPLPIGIFLPADSDHPAERLTAYTLKPDIDTGYYSSLLGGLEEKEAPSPETLIKNLTSFLSRIIAKFGDYTLEQIAKRLCCNVNDFIGRMWIADAMTILLGARLKICSTFDFAVNTACPCPKNKTIVDNPEELRDYHSLSQMPIKFINDLSAPPLYKVTVPNGVSDGLSTITDFYLQPLKLHQLPKIISKEKGLAFNVKQLIEMVAAIPQSEVYGSVKNRPFCVELYNPMKKKDQACLDRAMGKINPGPDFKTELHCYHCDRNFDWQFPWPQLRYFLYNSDEYQEQQ